MTEYPIKIVYAEIHSAEEQAFYDALVHVGMEQGSYAIAAAMLGFRRWREQSPQLSLPRELPENPGPGYSAGEYSRRNYDAMVSDAVGQSTGK